MRHHDWLKCGARASSDVGLAEKSGAFHLSRRCWSEGRLSVCQLCLATQSKSCTGLKPWTSIGEFQEGLWWCGPHRFQLNDNEEVTQRRLPVKKWARFEKLGYLHETKRRRAQVCNNVSTISLSSGQISLSFFLLVFWYSLTLYIHSFIISDYQDCFD